MIDEHYEKAIYGNIFPKEIINAGHATDFRKAAGLPTFSIINMTDTKFIFNKCKMKRIAAFIIIKFLLEKENELFKKWPHCYDISFKDTYELELKWLFEETKKTWEELKEAWEKIF